MMVEHSAEEQHCSKKQRDDVHYLTKGTTGNGQSVRNGSKVSVTFRQAPPQHCSYLWWYLLFCVELLLSTRHGENSDDYEIQNNEQFQNDKKK